MYAHGIICMYIYIHTLELVSINIEYPFNIPFSNPVDLHRHRHTYGFGRWVSTQKLTFSVSWSVNVSGGYNIHKLPEKYYVILDATGNFAISLYIHIHRCLCEY